MQVRTARSQWLAEEEGGIDDCTAIVCMLQQGDRPRRTGSMLPSDASKAATSISRCESSLDRLRVPKRMANPSLTTLFVLAPVCARRLSNLEGVSIADEKLV